MSSASGIYSSLCKLPLMKICPTKGTNTNTNLGLKHLQSGICVFIQCQCRLHQVYAVHHVETNKCPIYIKDENTNLGLKHLPVWYLCIHIMIMSYISDLYSSPCKPPLMIICLSKDTNTNTNLGLKHLQSGICVFIQCQCRLHQVYAVHHVETNKCPIYIKDENTNLGLKHLQYGICVFIQCQCRLHQVYAVHHVETNKCPIYIKR